MKLLILMTLAALGFAQIHTGGWDRLLGRMDDTIDTMHLWRLEDHHVDATHEHLLIFINDQPHILTCYVIVVDHSWENLLDSEINVQAITEEIFGLVTSPHEGRTPVSNLELRSVFHDAEAANECRRHTVFSIAYTPSLATQS